MLRGVDKVAVRSGSKVETLLSKGLKKKSKVALKNSRRVLWTRQIAGCKFSFGTEFPLP